MFHIWHTLPMDEPDASQIAAYPVAHAVEVLERGTVADRLPGLLLAVAEGRTDREVVNALVRVCHGLAVVALRHKVTKSFLALQLGTPNYADLAYDCIADFFRKDDDGTLRQFQIYFADIDPLCTPPHELLIRLRRLVFSKVNNSLWRLYNECDPELGRIIRNIKLALQEPCGFCLTERFGEAYLSVNGCDRLEELPEADFRELEEMLLMSADGTENIPVLLEKFARQLREQEVVARMVPLVTLALVVRSMAYHRKEEEPSETVISEVRFLNEEVSVAITNACRRIWGKMYMRYPGSGRVATEDYERYFRIIVSCLRHRYIGLEEEPSLFAGMQCALPGLTRVQYDTQYRAQLEYLYKLCHDAVVADLKKDYR